MGGIIHGCNDDLELEDAMLATNGVVDCFCVSEWMLKGVGYGTRQASATGSVNVEGVCCGQSRGNE